MQMNQKIQENHSGVPSTFVCGVDIVELEQFTRVLKIGGVQFLDRVYTDAELALCSDQVPRLAGRFAAKEAISKALGSGVRSIDWDEMEVLSDQYGCPFVSLYGRAAARAEQMCLCSWTVSISHSPTLAIAFVVASRL